MSFVEYTLECLIQHTERYTGSSLPRKVAFRWLDEESEPLNGHIIEAIVERVFLDERHIYPCVSIGIVDTLDDSLVVVAEITKPFAKWMGGCEPQPFRRNWSGRAGPFVYFISEKLVDRLKGIDRGSSTWMYLADTTPW